MSSFQNKNDDSEKFLGPKGLGDPEDRTLRKVEKDILIPKMMKEEVKTFCAVETAAFSKCSKEYGLLMPFKCREEKDIMNDCTIKWYQNEEYLKQTTEKYIQERAEYRRTGIPVRRFQRH